MTSPKDNSSLCHNCGHEVRDQDTFCPNCGQRRRSARLTISELFSESIITVIGYDSQVWRTLTNLWTPGKLPQSFRDGHRKSFVHPVRLFLFTFLVMVLVMSLTSNSSDENLLEIDGPIDFKAHQTAEDGSKIPITELDSIFGGVDSLTVIMKPLKSEERPTRIPKSWLDEYSLDEIVAKLNPTSKIQGYIIKQQLRLYQEGQGFADFLTESLVWMFLILQPVLAFFLLLVMWRHTYYSDHLIWSVYTHATIFVLVIGLFLVDALAHSISTDLSTFLSFAGVSGIIVYIAVSLKRYYNLKRRYLAILLPYILTVYIVSLLLALLLNLLITFLLF